MLCAQPYIQQVFWAKKYLPRKSEGFRDSILNSKFFITNQYLLISLTMSLKKIREPVRCFLPKGFPDKC